MAVVCIAYNFHQSQLLRYNLISKVKRLQSVKNEVSLFSFSFLKTTELLFFSLTEKYVLA